MKISAARAALVSKNMHSTRLRGRFQPAARTQDSDSGAAETRAAGQEPTNAIAVCVVGVHDAITIGVQGCAIDDAVSVDIHRVTNLYAAASI